MNYDISVVMPALNEEVNIQRAVEDVMDAFYRLKISGEIIVVDDGSIDRTLEIVNRIIKKNSFISIVYHDKPKGIGASFWAGVLKSQSDLVTLLPGDGEGNAYELLQYLPLMNHVDLIIPFAYNAREVRPFIRWAISKIFTIIINLSFGSSLTYTNGFVIYRKCVLKDITLKNGGFFYQAELIIKTLKRRYLYAEVPLALHKRLEGDSTALTIKPFFKVVGGYFSTIFAIYLFDTKYNPLSKDSVTFLRRKQLKKTTKDKRC